jgi:choline dehydrogenase-like flavoprotein
MCADRVVQCDVAIVGSGIAGALIAKKLGLAGKKVVILEAGAKLPPDINAYMNRFYTAAFKVPEVPYTPEVFTPPGGTTLTNPETLNAGRPTVMTLAGSNWQDPAKSYLIQQGPLAFASTYERIAGGTVQHWLGTSLRFLPSDFRMKSLFGRFVDWPIGYSDLEPWYGQAEAEIGVSADKADQGYLGISFPTNYAYPMPKIPPSLVDSAVAKGLGKFTFDGVELAVTNTPAARNSQPYQNRRACAGNTNCIPICPIQAKYDPSVTLNEATRTGNVNVMYRTVASEIVLEPDLRRVKEIKFIEYKKDDGDEKDTGTISATVFIIAGNAIETPRLLLMSGPKDPSGKPLGIANSSGMVGRNLMDHPLYLAWALMPDPVYPYRGPLSTSGIESLRDGPFRRERGAFRIEIGNEGWNFSKSDPNTTTMDFITGSNDSRLNPRNEALFGQQLVTRLNAVLSRQFRLGFLIEQSPDEDNRVTLSDKFKDHLDLPRPQVAYNLSDYTKKGIAAAKSAADAIFAKLNATQFTEPPPDGDPTAFDWPVGGSDRLKYYGAGHIVGTYRMGTNKDNSVVNDAQRSWDHDNMYLVGSGTFPTVATANPTLTIAALSLRTAQHVVDNAFK